MKITEETKIKDIIPEGYEVRTLETNPKFISNTIIIYYQQSHKKFGEYVKEFYRAFDPDTSEALNLMQIEPEHLNMSNKLGLLWHILKDKKGNWHDWTDLQAKIEEDDYPVSDVAEEVYSILPKSFINSLKEG